MVFSFLYFSGFLIDTYRITLEAFVPPAVLGIIEMSLFL